LFLCWTLATNHGNVIPETNNGVETMKNFVMHTAAFLIWVITLCVVSLAPIVFDGPEAIAAMLCATIAAFGIMTVIFWESL